MTEIIPNFDVVVDGTEADDYILTKAGDNWIGQPIPATRYPLPSIPVRIVTTSSDYTPSKGDWGRFMRFTGTTGRLVLPVAGPGTANPNWPVGVQFLIQNACGTSLTITTMPGAQMRSRAGNNIPLVSTPGNQQIHVILIAPRIWAVSEHALGLQGPAGQDGADGIDGVDGAPGEKGDKGDTGDKGDPGDRGDQGEQGIEGPQGAPGPGITYKGTVANAAALPGSGNTLGDAYITLDVQETHIWNGSSWDNLGSLQGIQGIQGIQGVKGDKGDQGNQGDPGLDGADGADGADGLDGAPGTVWHHYEETPEDDPIFAAGIGIDGDRWLAFRNSTTWIKLSGVWEFAGRLAGDRWIGQYGAPTAVEPDGTWSIDFFTGYVHRRESGAWSIPYFSMIGQGVPPGGTTGQVLTKTANGDFLTGWATPTGGGGGGGGAPQVNSDWNATSGVAQILNKPTIPAAQVNSDWSASSGVAQILNKPTLFSGAYADLTGKPTLFSGAYADLTGKPTLFDGAYASLTGKPTLFSGSYIDLSDKPTIPAAQVPSDWSASSGVAAILNKPTLFSGAYADLTGKPTLFSGAYADLTGKPTLFSGAYADLTGKPTLFDGTWSSLTGKPSFATVATSGAYSDLTGAPGAATITNTSDGTSHTVTLSASGGSVQLVEGANITLTTTGTSADGVVTIASAGGGGELSSTSDSTSHTLTSSGGGSIQFVEGSGVSLTTSGTSGAAVLTIASSVSTVRGGINYQFTTSTTDADPGAGLIAFNSGTIASVTQLYIDNTDRGGVTQTGWLDSWDDGLAAADRGVLTIQARDAGDATTSAIFRVTGDVVDGTGYRKVPVTYISGSLPANSTELVLSYNRTGDPARLVLNSNAATPGYTLVLADRERMNRFTTTSSLTLTVPTNASVAFAVGDQVIFEQAQVGVITVVGDVGVSVNVRGSRNKTAGRYAVATLIKTDTNAWSLYGDLTT